MFGFLTPRAMRLKQLCRQLDVPFEQESDGTVHCRFNTSTGLGIATLSPDSDGMLYVVGSATGSGRLRYVPDGLGEFLAARNQRLSSVGWRAKNGGDHLRLSLVGALAFSDVNVMSLASILNEVASESAEVAEILVGRGVFHG